MARRSQSQNFLRPHIQSGLSTHSVSQPPSPIPLRTPSTFGSSSPQYTPPPVANPEEAPPPSYEDAIAEDIGPVDGPRRDYSQPEVTRPVGDEKRGGRFRNDERLFPWIRSWLRMLNRIGSNCGRDYCVIWVKGRFLEWCRELLWSGYCFVWLGWRPTGLGHGESLELRSLSNSAYHGTCFDSNISARMKVYEL